MTYSSSSAVSAVLSEGNTVQSLQDAAKDRFCNSHLAGINASDLEVYVSRTVYEDSDGGQCLAWSDKLSDFGKDESSALIVAVPSRQVPKFWFQVADGATGGTFSRAVSVSVTEYSTVERLRDAAKEKYFNSYLTGIDAANLKVYASSAVRESSERGQNLAPSDKLGDSGSSADNPLIIQVPKVWLQLVSSSTHAASTGVVSVPLTEDSTVERLRNAVKEKYCNSHLAGIATSGLMVYASRAVYEHSGGELSLGSLDMLTGLGKDDSTAITVVVPSRLAVLTTVPRITLPLTEVLKNSQGVARGCLSVADWNTGTVHNIPLVWNFMSNLGGCTDIGEIFWRLEDKQAVFQLEDGWFRESSLGNYNAQANKKSILVGSSGIGKSTLLCSMAFYLVIKYKKNVLVYRHLTNVFGNCLFILGTKATTSCNLQCKDAKLTDIYDELNEQQGISKVWLLLDGFHYREVPEGLEAFRMLAISQQVLLKSQERLDTYCWLLPCWLKNNLQLMGRMIYKFDDEEMNEWYYYSGGSVREFTLPTAESIREAIDGNVSNLSCGLNSSKTKPCLE
ncbi:hypothetical protein PC128_g21972 [Phytophthora cactorum]|nr:hypothetical protein PC128_g21972 [Phytophthora cactorum]